MAEIHDNEAEGKNIAVWFQDECCVGQKNKLTRHWSKRGSPPRLANDQRTKSAHIFGAICPEQGKGADFVLPSCDTHAMNLHLAEISRQVDADAHAVVVLDQAGWHTTKDLVVSRNITLLPLPPRAPK